MSFLECWERVRGIKGLETKSKMARFLGITTGSVGGARARGKFPSDWAIKIADAHNMNANWILTGKGPRLLGVEEEKEIYQTAPEQTKASGPRDEIIEAFKDKYIEQLKKNQELLEQVQELKDERFFLKNKVEEVVKEIEALKKMDH